MNREPTKTAAWLAAASAGALLLAASAQVAADHHSTPTITEIVLQSGGDFDRNRHDYDILLQAVVTAGLDGTLDDENADFTVFAPTDRAFIRLARDLGFKGWDEAGAFSTIVDTLTILGKGDPVGPLTDILLYHVDGEAKTLAEIRHVDVIETLLPDSGIVPFRSQLLDADPDFKNPRLLAFKSDIVARNGIIHTINRVLIPSDLPNNDPDSEPTIAEIVGKSGGNFDFNRFDYDLLLTALQTAGLDGTLNDRTGDFTVFAPNDAAFVRLARSLGYRGFRESGAFEFIVGALTELGGGDPIPLLTAVLLYHVSPGTQVVKDVILSDTIDTLFDDATFYPDGRRLEDNAPAVRDPRLVLFASDLRAANGIIHTINRVLLPIPVGQ
ncbi:MAG: fasciclin domain-containing protein [Gammaproteobacteria bacterium]|nr:fasciclin domain-containing protein [Gammaproteobacteria bacterium]